MRSRCAARRRGVRRGRIGRGRVTSRLGEGSRERKRNWGGFTLIEMLVVISIIMVLLAVAVQNYNHNITLAKEAKLHQDLFTLNKVITEYSLNKGHAPQSLDDLVQEGYLKFIPDDITGSPDWVPDQEDDPDKSWDPNNQGIKGVHSASDEMSLSNGPYSSWTH
jgi:general secretion pathway protein G